jgi:hypothetical protein
VAAGFVLLGVVFSLLLPASSQPARFLRARGRRWCTRVRCRARWPSVANRHGPKSSRPDQTYLIVEPRSAPRTRRRSRPRGARSGCRADVSGGLQYRIGRLGATRQLSS